jgi:hypothetical protein
MQLGFHFGCFSVKVNRTNHANKRKEIRAQLATAYFRDFSIFIDNET